MNDGQQHLAEQIELQDRIVVEASEGEASGGQAVRHFEFEVVGIVEDSDSQCRYAVCYSEDADEFIVTDNAGQLLDDASLAQAVLDDFLAQAARQEDDG